MVIPTASDLVDSLNTRVSFVMMSEVWSEPLAIRTFLKQKK
jgi:hypothetical protein